MRPAFHLQEDVCGNVTAHLGPVELFLHEWFCLTKTAQGAKYWSAAWIVWEPPVNLTSLPGTRACLETISTILTSVRWLPLETEKDTRTFILLKLNLKH